MSVNTPRAQATANAIKQLREEKAQEMMRKLKYEVIPNLESVIAGTPTGERRNQLTDANIILQRIVAE